MKKASRKSNWKRPTAKEREELKAEIRELREQLGDYWKDKQLQLSTWKKDDINLVRVKIDNIYLEKKLDSAVKTILFLLAVLVLNTIYIFFN